MRCITNPTRKKYMKVGCSQRLKTHYIWQFEGDLPLAWENRTLGDLLTSISNLVFQCQVAYELHFSMRRPTSMFHGLPQLGNFHFDFYGTPRGYSILTFYGTSLLKVKILHLLAIVYLTQKGLTRIMKNLAISFLPSLPISVAKFKSASTCYTKFGKFTKLVKFVYHPTMHLTMIYMAFLLCKRKANWTNQGRVKPLTKHLPQMNGYRLVVHGTSHQNGFFSSFANTPHSPICGWLTPHVATLSPNWLPSVHVTSYRAHNDITNCRR